MPSGLWDIPTLFLTKWFPPKRPTASFAGKTIIVTGSNTGLGYEAARIYLEQGASRVILGVRTVSKGETAAEQLAKDTGRQGIVTVLRLDMDNFDSAREFARSVEASFGHVDVVVLNAALENREYKLTSSGWEETLLVNLLSTTLVALLLLPCLMKTRKENPQSLPHLVFVGSGGHANVPRSALPNAPVDILKQLSAAPQGDEAYAGVDQYSTSKLLLCYAVREIAKLATTDAGKVAVSVTSCCPGFCTSNIGRDYGEWYIQWALWVFEALCARSSEEGSRTMVSASLLGEEAQGKFWTHDKLAP